jgi:RND family efflux transporter MFP subunit
MNAFARRLPLLLILAVAALVALPFTACAGDADTEATPAGWHCPMHPTYTADRPGDCPICNMRLVPIAGDGEGHTAAPPAVASAGGGDPAGLATVTVGEQGMRVAGVRTEPARRERVEHTTRTVGLVTADERRVRQVQTKVAGWVETLHVSYTGQSVRAGQPVLTLYSPELLASQEELVRAREAAARFAGSSLPEVRRGAEDLVAAARRRLELLDVPPALIAALERGDTPRRAVTLTSPGSGLVTAKQVVAGQEVRPGSELFTLTDLSHVWVEADFYEHEAALLRVGQQLEIELPYQPGAPRRAPITFIYPTLASESRTLKVRVELDNPDGELRPGMYVDVVARLSADQGVTVPADAVLDSGLRQVVFVERAPGTFEPREVRVGVQGEGRVVLLAGVAEGERVATRANFLLDSESRLRAALAALPAAGDGEAAAATPPGHVH